jgi:hypothetical protein
MKAVTSREYDVDDNYNSVDDKDVDYIITIIRMIIMVMVVI